MKELALERLADLICGDDQEFAPVYRSSWYLTHFFESVGLSRFRHDGSTRKWWVLSCLRQCSDEEIQQVVLGLASPKTYQGKTEHIRIALASLNEVLNPEGLSIKINGVEPVISKIEPCLSRPLDINSNEVSAIFQRPDFNSLGIDPVFSDLLAKRWEEIEKCLQAHAYLASLILMGSLLEGMLVWSLTKFPEKANRASVSPKDSRTGKPRPVNDWTLSQMIDVAHELGWLGIDVRQYCHSLREFRNLVHPFQQMRQSAIPDEDTCKISWQVVQASINDLAQTFTSSLEEKN